MPWGNEPADHRRIGGARWRRYRFRRRMEGVGGAIGILNLVWFSVVGFRFTASYLSWKLLALFLGSACR